MRGNGAASVTPASSSRHLPVTQHTGRNWLNAETVESREGVRCRPARSSTDVCQRGAVRQRIGGGNTPWGVSPHPHGARLALGLIHYPVGQPLLGDSLPFLLTTVTDKELLIASEAPGAVHVYAQCSYGTQQRQGWVCLLRRQCLQVHHLIAEGRGGNLGHAWPARENSCAITGTWCFSTSASWGFGSTGKRESSPLRRESLFLVWS